MSAQHQLTFNDAAAARDAAMEAAEIGALEHWKIAAWDFLVQYLRTHREMCTDDLWDAGLPRTRENRALGPLVMRAARAGYIVKADYRPSLRRHLTPQVVWRSLICEVTP